MPISIPADFTSDRCQKEGGASSSKAASPCYRSHDLILRQATVRIGVHAVTAASRSKVFDVAEAQRAPAVLVCLEFGNSRVGGLGSIETNDSTPSGAAAGLVLYLSLLDFSDSAEQLD